MSTPYTVTPEGVQLNDGATFEAHGHINIKITTADGTYIRDAGIHFDPYNNQPGGAFIGQSFYPVELAEGECIGWVQWSGTPYHHGENGEPPVCEPVTPVTPPQPANESRVVETEGAPNCEELVVTITATREEAGYYLGNDGQWWLGDFFPVDSKEYYRQATAEECPAPPAPQPEEPSTPTPAPAPTPAPTPAPAPLPVVDVQAPAAPASVAVPTGQVHDAALAQTGAPDVALPLFGAVLVAAGAAVFVARRMRGAKREG